MAAALHLVVPSFVTAASDRLGARPLPSFGWGIAAVVAAPVSVVALAITLIGIPLAALVGLLLLLLTAVGSVVAAYWAGLVARGFVSASLEDPSFLSRVLWTLAGFAAITAVGWVPYVGSLAAAALFLTAIGAILVALWTRFSGPAPVSPAV